jgi:radical SAM protein
VDAATLAPRSAVRHPRYSLDERPFIVIWELTRACDLVCRHCRAESCPTRSASELTTEEGYRLMEQVASFGPPPPMFVLTGGDPFKRPDLLDLVRYGAKLHLPVSVAPSATPLLNAESLAKLREAGAVALSLSLDGSTAETHDGFRGVPGTYDRTLACWQKARELGFKVQINTTVTPLNLYQLPDMVRLVRDFGVMNWSLFFLVPTGRGQTLLQLSPGQFEDVLNFLYDAGKLISLKATEAPHYRRVVIERSILERKGEDPRAVMGLGPTYDRLSAALREIAPDLHPEEPGRIRRAPLDVNAGRGYIFVSHVGDACPSGFLPVVGGNVREQSLQEIYRTAPLFQSLRHPDELHGRCGRCEFRTLCGGSRSRAFGHGGDLLGEDPWCVYTPGSFPHPEDLEPFLNDAVPAALAA